MTDNKAFVGDDTPSAIPSVTDANRPVSQTSTSTNLSNEPPNIHSQTKFPGRPTSKELTPPEVNTHVGQLPEKAPLPDQPTEELMTQEAFQYNAEKKALQVLTTAVIAAEMNKPYAGMGKEDLLRFSQTPFWSRLRMACLIFFWVAWAALLGTVIGLTVTFPKCNEPPEKPWQETAVFYQIYVRSFYDSNGDGIGDLEGIRQKLDYLSDLNTDAIILSSIYQTKTTFPADHGYEIINHTAINYVYGTEEDFDQLLEEAHDHDIKVILDFIPNYTGLEHPWFERSVGNSSVSNPYWNYYVWTDCNNDIDPNNWRTVYGESMWTRNGTRQQCYLHQFLDTQPELNLRSSAVQEELQIILRYWLGKGVDGFKVDKVKFLFEDTDFKNEPWSGDCSEDDSDLYHCYDHIYTTSQDEIYPLVASWRAVLDEYTRSTQQTRVLLTDAMDTLNNSLRYYGKYGPDGAHYPMNFELTKINTSCSGKCMFNLVDNWLYGTPTFSTPDWMTGNQDLHRMASLIPGDWNHQNAVTMLKLTLPGVVMMYYGEEIGMENVNNTIDLIEDPAGEIMLTYSRDPFRSPMQWTMESDTAGFTDNETDPWLPVGENLNQTSVEGQNGTAFSPYEFYKELAELRTTSETFHVGAFQYTLLTDNIISYYRYYQGKDSYLVAINFGPDGEEVNIGRSHYDVPGSAEVVMTTHGDMSVAVGDMASLTSLNLQPGDGVIVKWPYVRPNGKPSSL